MLGLCTLRLRTPPMHSEAVHSEAVHSEAGPPVHSEAGDLFLQPRGHVS